MSIKFWSGNVEGKYHVGDKSVHAKNILKWSLKKLLCSTSAISMGRTAY